MRPETRYARNGELHIAYQVFGSGPPDLVVVDQWFGNVEAQWDFPPLAAVLERLASFARVITFDKRGTGISDPVGLDALPTLEQWIDDLHSVLDATGSIRPFLLSGIGSSLMTLLYAASTPERTSGLVMVDPYARVSRAPDYPIGSPIAQLEAGLGALESAWGTRGGLLNFLAPRLLGDPALVDAYQRFERHSASPGVAIAMLRMLWQSDVRHVLPAIRVPTLVLARGEGSRIEPAHGRYIADRIAGARFVSVPGTENLIWAGDTEALLGEIQQFVAGTRPAPEPDRVLATVLFTDLVGSTRRAAELGDRAWRSALVEHDRIVRAAIADHRGREIKTTGDGFLATFDGPARAVRCAAAIREGLAAVGLAVRSGLHAGEIELLAGDVGGIAVHIAARVCAIAGADEILASSTVRDLVAGSGIEFEDRGLQALKGIPDEWRIVAVRSV